MGCVCNTATLDKAGTGGSVVENMMSKKNSTKDIKSSSLNKKGISITAGTFVNEKRFKQFMEEYVTQDIIGRGKTIIVIYRGIWNCKESKAYSNKPNKGYENNKQEEF